MRFPPGTRLGTYELVAVLGAGGMGEVYRARDTSLQRDVAIKLVRPELCGNADSLARLRREARALAALDHPHVATVHELREVDEACCIVMELVGGETLGALLARRRLEIAETLRIASQIAAALEAAHERGIVHRDLKPANVKITPDGVVKVLDFGLALAEPRGDEPDSRVGPTTFATSAGVVMGTAAYMSPEQARGRAVDRRTDLWALGCVLFEMLAGRRAFVGETTTDTLVAVLEREPDWAQLPAETPPAVRHLLRRCLEKDARRRLRDAGDARLEIDDALAALATPLGGAARPPARQPPSWPLVAGAGLIGGAAIAALVAYLVVRPLQVPPDGAVRFTVSLPPGDELGWIDFPAVLISPDGRLLAYVVAQGERTALALRPMDALAATVIPGTEGAHSPFFSPDSRWLAFFADGLLKRVPVAGGPSVTICGAEGAFGGSWGADDTITFAGGTGSPLLRVAAAGGSPSRITRLDTDRGEFSHRWPEWVDEQTVLYTVGTVGNWDEAEIVAERLDNHRRAVLVTGGTHPRYLADGRLLYTHAGTVWSVAFDRDDLRIAGEPRRVLDGVLTSPDGAAQFSVARSGARAYVPAPAAGGRRLASVEGAIVTPFVAPLRAYASPRVSPDGTRLIVTIADDTEQVWLYDVASAALKQLTFDAAARGAIWTPDGQRITFSSARGGVLNLYTMRADRRGSPERLRVSDSVQLPGSWAPDGSLLAYVEQHPVTGRDVWLLESDGEARPFVSSPFDESAPRFSPDGRWVAFVSNETGSPEVYVKATAGSAAPRRVSADGGREPVWAPDGRSLFYRAGSRLVESAFSTEGTLRGAARTALDDTVGAEPGTLDFASYDAVPGTRRLVVLLGSGQPAAPTEFRVELDRQR
jgi:serine/threonine-protein kinase